LFGHRIRSAKSAVTPAEIKLSWKIPMRIFIGEPPFFQVAGEAGNRRRLGIEGLKHTGELRDDQQILQTIAEMK
jgi:hypothetical protein